MRILISIAFLCSLFVASPANAQTEDVCGFDYMAPSVSESMCWPVQSDIVVIESPYKNIWGIRRAAIELSNYLDLTFMWYRGVQCEDFPGATCIRVDKEDTRGYSGYTTFPDLFSTRQIVLDIEWQGNPEWREYRRYVGLHEFGHAIGLSHHDEVGLMGNGSAGLPDWFSWSEMNLLQETYN